MGCGASSFDDEEEDTRTNKYRVGPRPRKLERRGTQYLKEDLGQGVRKGEPAKKNLDGTPILDLEQQPGQYAMCKTRLLGKTFGKPRFRNLVKGYHTIARGPPPGDEVGPKARIVPDFTLPFVVNMTADEEFYLRTMTVKRLQKSGAVKYKGHFSVAYTDDDDPGWDCTVAALSPRSFKRKKNFDKHVELGAVEEALGHLVLKLLAPRVADPEFLGAELRPLASFGEAVMGLVIPASEGLVTVSTARTKFLTAASLTDFEMSLADMSTHRFARRTSCDSVLSKRDAMLLSRRALRSVCTYTGEELQPFHDPIVEISREVGVAPTQLALIQDDQVLVTVEDGGVVYWDVSKRARWKELATGRHFDAMQRYTTCAVSGCGRMVAAGGEVREAGAVALFRDSQQFLNFMDHLAMVTAVEFSPSGDWVLSGDASGEVILWNVQTGRWRGRVRAHRDAVLSVIFLTDTSVITLSATSMRRWDVTDETAPEEGEYRPTRAGLELVWNRHVGADDDKVMRSSVCEPSRAAQPCRNGMTPTGDSCGSFHEFGPGSDVDTTVRFVTATLAPGMLLAVLQTSPEVLLISPADGTVRSAVYTRGIATAIAPGRAMCAVGDALGNVYALDIHTTHSLPGPSNPLNSTPLPHSPRPQVRRRGSTVSVRSV